MPSELTNGLIEAAREYMRAVSFRLDAQQAFRSEDSEENSRLYGIAIDGIRYAERNLRDAIAKAEAVNE